MSTDEWAACDWGWDMLEFVNLFYNLTIICLKKARGNQNLLLRLLFTI